MSTFGVAYGVVNGRQVMLVPKPRPCPRCPDGVTTWASACDECAKTALEAMLLGQGDAAE